MPTAPAPRTVPRTARSKAAAWIITALCAAAFLLAARAMAGRIAEFNKAAAFRHYHAVPLMERSISLRGFPPLTIADGPPAERESDYAIRVTYGEGANATVRDIPVRQPVAFNLPHLGMYDEWARLLAINQVERDAAGNPVPKEGSERLILVVRRTPEGFDPDTWGSVRRTDWVFDYYDFGPDGTIEYTSRRWPMSTDRRERSFQGRAADPAAPPELKALAAVEPVGERTLEFFAALHVIPKLNVPKHKFTDTAFDVKTLGWTLPVVMLSGLGFSLAFFFALTPGRIHDRAATNEPRA